MSSESPNQRGSWAYRLNRALNRPAWRWTRFFRDVALDLLLLNISLFAAFYLVYEFTLPISEAAILSRFATPLSLVTLVILTWRGAHRINARYLGLYDFVNLVFVVMLSAFALAGLEIAQRFTDSVRGLVLLPAMYGFLAMSLLAGVRILQRQYDWQVVPNESRRMIRKRALVVGAGDAGETIVREMNRSRRSEYVPIAFVDDDPEKYGLSIHGVKVAGPTSRIPELVEQQNIEEVVLAVPSANGATIRRIVNMCDEAGVRVRTLPPVTDVLRQDNKLRHTLRDIDIEDLLRREPANSDLTKSAAYINAETVLVTGGGGSIGSELARQIARLAPARLILVGKGENSIYEIEQELIQVHGASPICVIADAGDRAAMEHLFDTHKPTVVFHAAAHKHVPLMQSNAVEAIKNNILATEMLCELSTRFGVRKFVYISTDKAVRPSSVMGATKRVGEMIVRMHAQRSETEFAIVRFGNVLGSRGSLVPLLKKQISRGGPVRLTHAEMTRYFMTIPEAVQLILQAGSLGRHAELFILDMGEPVKIVDLARDLIRLHGLVPGEDIEIQFTGIRPGEKLHEELVYEREELAPTPHAKIRVVKAGAPMNEEWMRSEIANLRDLCGSRDQDTLRTALMELAWGKSTVPYQYAAVEVNEAKEGAESNEPS